MCFRVKSFSLFIMEILLKKIHASKIKELTLNNFSIQTEEREKSMCFKMIKKMGFMLRMTNKKI